MIHLQRRPVTWLLVVCPLLAPTSSAQVNRYSQVRLIQSTPERVIVHWRYMPNMPEKVGPENLPDQTRMVDEYYAVFPDRSVIRAVLAGQPRYEDWRKAAPGRVIRYQLTSSAVDIRQGVVRRANGVNALVVWLEMSTTEPVQVIIQQKS